MEEYWRTLPITNLSSRKTSPPGNSSAATAEDCLPQTFRSALQKRDQPENGKKSWRFAEMRAKLFFLKLGISETGQIIHHSIHYFIRFLSHKGASRPVAVAGAGAAVEDEPLVAARRLDLGAAARAGPTLRRRVSTFRRTSTGIRHDSSQSRLKSITRLKSINTSFGPNQF